MTNEKIVEWGEGTLLLKNASLATISKAVENRWKLQITEGFLGPPPDPPSEDDSWHVLRVPRTEPALEDRRFRYIAWRADAPDGRSFGRAAYYPLSDDDLPSREHVLALITLNMEDTLEKLLLPEVPASPRKSTNYGV